MEIKASQVKELREMSGVAMMECKRALVDCEGDIEKALDLLRSNSALKAEKKATRVAAEGILKTFSGNTHASLIEINSETEFKLLQKSKDYSNPREEETESKFPEIVKNIALIYKELGQNDKALAAIEAARSSNPDDVGLIITAANIYFELDNKEAFKVAMSEAIEKEPNNPVLYYNLGVVSGELGEKDAARNILSPGFRTTELDEVTFVAPTIE